MWPFKKKTRFSYLGLVYVEPDVLASKILDRYAEQYRMTRQSKKVFWFFKRRETDEEFRARIKEVMQPTQRPVSVTIPEGVKTIVPRLQAGYVEHLKQEVVGQVNPPSFEGRFGEEVPNPNYDPNLTFEEATEKHVQALRKVR